MVFGGPLGSVCLGAPPPPGPGGGKQVDDRFQTSYAATFSRAPSAPKTLAPRPTFGSAASGALLRTSAANSMKPPAARPVSSGGSAGAGPRAAAAERGASPSSTLLSLSSAARLPTAPLLEALDRRADFEHRRRTLELLADPDLGEVAQEIFTAYNASRNGRLECGELCAVLATLHEQLDLPRPDPHCVERLFKKFDVNDDKTLAFAEFFELLKAELRRSAFDRSTLVNREFFITKSSSKVWDNYTKAKELGAGSFGTAYLAIRKVSQEQRVVKAVHKSRTNLPLDDIEQEILIMRQVDHPHVVRLFEWYEDSTMIYLVMEALKGGTLKDVVLSQRKGIKEDWIRKVVSQSVSGMAYCHNLRLIHKDLKDENIMLLRKDNNFDEPFAVIIDLGIAEMFSLADPGGRLMGGTPMTMAPEVWTGNFGPKCDVFSLGVILYELLAGSYPFMANSMQPNAWMCLHKRGPDWTRIRSSNQGRSLCKAMLTYRDSERPTMRQCVDHEWFEVHPRELRHVSPEQLKPFVSVCYQQQVKRKLLLEIASRLPMETAGEIIDLFESLDTNRDGTLSSAELRTFFDRMGVEDRALCDQVFQALDADQDGSLTFTEFASGALLLFRDKLDKSLHELFVKHDPNGDGALDKAEALDFLDDVFAAIAADGSLRGGRPQDTLDQMLASNQNRKIPYEQLRDFILSSSGGQRQ